MARRRRSRGFTKRQGRQGLWVRHETFTPTDVVTAPKYTEDAVVFPQIWEREQLDLTNPKKGAGGPLLKRAFGSVSWEIRQADTAATVNSPNFEILVFAASTEEPAASAAADFAANLERQRVLHYSMMGPVATILVANDTGDATRWYGNMAFDIKVAARLAGQDIVISTRCAESETANVTIGVRVQFSAYVTTP